MKPPVLMAWENGPTGGVSSGEVIAVLLMENSCGYWVKWSGWWNRTWHALPVSRAVINIDVVQARRRLAQAHLSRPGLTDLDRCPVQNLGTASLPNLNRMRHQGFHKSINSL